MMAEKGYLLDEDIELELAADDFEMVKAKNILCRYHGIATERWQEVDGENRMALFLTGDFDGPDAPELIRKVFHDPAYKTRRRRREEERKSEMRGGVQELFDALRDEWGDLFEQRA